MSKLNIDQKSVYGLLTDKHADYLIPDYQRPYAWGEDECQTLWDDLFEFALPGNNYENFDSKTDEYFLGPIVTFRNDDDKLEVIDGQQRLTTLMLLLRAFYDKFQNMKDPNSHKTYEAISRCVWKTNEFGEPEKTDLKIDSEVASDAHKDEFLKILSTGKTELTWKSNYAKNYEFFQRKIAEFITNFPSYTPYLPTRIMNNVILLPIEAESQLSALRIFSTLNDRGLPLSDADIFKSQFYKYFGEKNLKEEFVKRWKELEELTATIFPSSRGTPMDELFTRYMYYERAKLGIKETTTRALRDFYSANKYAILKKEETFNNLEKLAGFWKKVFNQDQSFSEDVLKQLFILHYAPNSMWTYLTSVYFLSRSDSEGALDNAKFLDFLRKTTGFIFANAVYSPGVSALRTPVYPEMVEITLGKELSFEKHKLQEGEFRSAFKAFSFSSNRPITKSMLAWVAFQNPKQKLLNLTTPLQTEHIYARNRLNKSRLLDEALMESLGNKSLLETSVNIRASDYRFEDKCNCYLGFPDKNGKKKPSTNIQDLIDLTNNKTDFGKSDIIERNEKILNSFVEYLRELDLIA